LQTGGIPILPVANHFCRKHTTLSRRNKKCPVNCHRTIHRALSSSYPQVQATGTSPHCSKALCLHANTLALLIPFC
jgi:hypothetical protein